MQFKSYRLTGQRTDGKGLTWEAKSADMANVHHLTMLADHDVTWARIYGVDAESTWHLLKHTDRAAFLESVAAYLITEED